MSLVCRVNGKWSSPCRLRDKCLGSTELADMPALAERNGGNSGEPVLVICLHIGRHLPSVLTHIADL